MYDPIGPLSEQLRHFQDEVAVLALNELLSVRSDSSGSVADELIVNTQDLCDAQGVLEWAARSPVSIPVICCSVADSPDQTRLRGALGYLVKPVSREDLTRSLGMLGNAPKHVLVVDDDPEMRHLLGRMIHLIDHTVGVEDVGTGKEALIALADNHFDLVLLDVILPDIDGWDVLRQLRQIPGCGELPVFLVSAQDLDDQPLVSPFLLATTAGGFSINNLLACALHLARVSRMSAAVPDSVPQRDDAPGRVSPGSSPRQAPAQAALL